MGVTLKKKSFCPLSCFCEVVHSDEKAKQTNKSIGLTANFVNICDNSLLDFVLTLHEKVSLFTFMCTCGWYMCS